MDGQEEMQMSKETDVTSIGSISVLRFSSAAAQEQVIHKQKQKEKREKDTQMMNHRYKRYSR